MIAVPSGANTVFTYSMLSNIGGIGTNYSADKTTADCSGVNHLDRTFHGVVCEQDGSGVDIEPL